MIRRKNIIEALLILKLLNSIKDEWQLLITLGAHSEKDKEYSSMITEYIRKTSLPTVIGFGYKLISPEETGLYTIVDLFGIADAIITTSTREGFGFTYTEGWLANKKVIGRRINFIFKDLEANGLNLKHFYNKILVNNKDFADYSNDVQLNLLDKLDYKNLLKQEEIKRMVDFLEKGDDQVIKDNKKKVIENYSLEAYAERLRKIIKAAESMHKKKFTQPKIDNIHLIEYFKK